MTSQTIAAGLPSGKKKRFGAGQIILNILMIMIVLFCTLPFINVIAVSLSSKSAILRGDVSFWPVEFTTKAYELIMKDPSMFRSLFFTVKITVIYTLLAMALTILYAFPLTIKRLKGRKFFMLFIVFTMFFSGGVIPIYLNVKELGMINSQWGLILPGLLSAFNIIILKNFFQGLPYELNEAAYIDGANDFQILVRIYLPLSFSSIASFSDALFYITSRDLQPLQLKLYNLIKGGQSVEVTVQEGNASDLASSVSASIEAATIIFATLPILLVYPFVQRYFVTGVTLGAVKG